MYNHKKILNEAFMIQLTHRNRRHMYRFVSIDKLMQLFGCLIFTSVCLLFLYVEIIPPMSSSPMPSSKSWSLRNKNGNQSIVSSPKEDGVVYICITGQLSRLELDTKIEKVIRPISDRYSDVRVALSLFMETKNFVNEEKSSDFVSPYSIQTARLMLMQNGAKTVNVYSVEHNDDIPINQNIINNYDKFYSMPDLKKKRAYGHIRQYESLYNCKHGLSDVETVPLFAVRLRDDLYVHSFDVDKIVDELHYSPMHSGRTIITPMCASWFGLNDKIAIVSGQYASLYFRSPLETYQRPMIEKWVINPETYYLSTFLNHGFFMFRSEHLEVVPTTLKQLDNCKAFVPRGEASCELDIIQKVESNGLKCMSVPTSCGKKIHYDETLWIAMTTWNDSRNFAKAVESIQSQTRAFSNIQHIVFEDYSNDRIDRKNFEDIIFIDGESNVQKGAAYGKWHLFEYIQKHSSPNDYVIVIDGDDVLSDESVFTYIQHELRRNKPWFAWGKINGRYHEQCGPLVGTTRNVRFSKWSICHPRIFSAHLLQSLNKTEFQRDDGEWLQKATDRPFIFSFMEQAGDDRILFLDKRPIYNYTWTHNNGLKLFSPSIIQGDKHLVNSRPPKQVQLRPIVLITCMWKGRDDVHFFQALMNSELPKNQTLDIHICNNDPTRQIERTAIANKISENSEHKITVHNMKQNTYGYGRFLLIQKLFKIQFLDYVIMLDDDQYVLPETIYNVYKQREPQTYKTWFGKNWDSSLSKPNYWNPAEAMCVKCDMKYWPSRLPNTNTWQYGGTGMSIIDANAFKIKEIYDLDTKYHNLEDMWLSYIVQLANYKIGRLKVKFTVQQELSSHGQFHSLKELKQDFFGHIEYLRCGSYQKKLISRPIPYVNNQIVKSDFDFGPKCDPKCALIEKQQVCFFFLLF